MFVTVYFYSTSYYSSESHLRFFLNLTYKNVVRCYVPIEITNKGWYSVKEVNDFYLITCVDITI